MRGAGAYQDIAWCNLPTGAPLAVCQLAGNGYFPTIAFLHELQRFRPS